MTATGDNAGTAAPPSEKPSEPPENARRKETPIEQTGIAQTSEQTGSEEIGGPKGPEPTRYGDWEVGGRCTDF